MVMAPLVRGRKGEHMRVLDDMRRAGYVRMFIDGEVRTLDEDIRLEKNKSTAFPWSSTAWRCAKASGSV